MQTVELLVDAARGLAKRGSAHAASTLFGRALQLDPTALDLHVELAEVELASGRLVEATGRLKWLANVYLEQDRLEEAEAVLAFVEELAETSEAGAVGVPQTGVTEPMTLVFGVPELVECTHTEFCSRPILLFPDGSPLPLQVAKPHLKPQPKATSRKASGRAPLRLRKPVAPPLRPPVRVIPPKLAAPKNVPADAAPRPKSRTDILPPAGASTRARTR